MPVCFVCFVWLYGCPDAPLSLQLMLELATTFERRPEFTYARLSCCTRWCMFFEIFTVLTAAVAPRHPFLYLLFFRDIALGRITFLPMGMSVPPPGSWLRDDRSNHRLTLLDLRALIG